jgi:hypothetical protein
LHFEDPVDRVLREGTDAIDLGAAVDYGREFRARSRAEPAC